MGLQPGFPVNRPADLGISVDQEMGGFAFNIEHGLFVPSDSTESANFILPPVWEEAVKNEWDQD